MYNKKRTQQYHIATIAAALPSNNKQHFEIHIDCTTSRSFDLTRLLVVEKICRCLMM
jgi:hypothetical protein